MRILDANYFAIGDLAVAYLQDVFKDDGLDVFSPANLQDLQEASQPDSAIYVIYFGEKLDGNPRNTVGDGQKRIVTQQWLFVVTQRNAASQLADTSDLKNSAGGTVAKLLQAMNGWSPSKDIVRSFYRVAGVPAGYSAAFAYFPFLYEIQFVA